jgi:glycosyltransferase involved in cell wall biosynthesis
MYCSLFSRPAGPDGMHILMIAPEPFFEPRGTPFSEFHRIRALTTLGHTVDLVTYPFGRDVTMPGLQIIRCLRPPFMRRIGIGPSWKKVPLDAALALTATRVALMRRYDAVHSHEEGGGIGVVLARLLRVPHLYDMHSSLPQQVANFGYGERTWLSTALGWLERVMIRNSKVIIVICQALETTVRGVDASVPTVVIENAPGSGAAPKSGAGVPIRASLGLAESDPIVLYTGTFENYQGLDLLYAAMDLVAKVRPDARLVMVGGEPTQVEEARGRVRALGLAASVIFTGQRPADEIPAYLDAATALASPRSTGTNTPLKIYQYLRSGRPIVATRLLTHTQVLSDDIAFLADATPAAFGQTILEALADPVRARAIGDRARQVATTRYSDEAFMAKTRTAIDQLARSDRREVAGRLA